MKYFKLLVAILLFPISGMGQAQSPDKFIEFKDVWVTENKEDTLLFNANNTDMKLFFKLVFDKNSILSFYINLGYSCTCTPALDRAREVKRINDTGSHLYYKADYIYTGFSIESPKKKLLTKEIPVEIWVNRVNHEVDLRIDNNRVMKQKTFFTYSFSLNPLLQKYGTSLPSAASIH